MLSEIETRRPMTAFVGSDVIDKVGTVFAPASDALRLSRRGSPSEGDSFFYIAMRVPGTKFASTVATEGW
jgi:hypothetical protein